MKVASGGMRKRNFHLKRRKTENGYDYSWYRPWSCDTWVRRN